MTIVFSDTFASPDGTTLQTHNASWSKNTADAPVDLVIKSGGVVLSSGAAPSTYINTAAGVLSDQLVEADIVFATASLGIHSVIARSATASRAFYLARWNAGLLQLYRFEAGSSVKHGSDISAPVTTGQTHRIGLRCVGSQISVEWNGVTKIGPITDATYASGYPGIRVIEPESVRIDNFSVDNLAASDTTAPTLTSPTATATGPTTASGSVSTTEGNGTLYWLASANATETAATVKAGSSQAVTATLEQPVTVTGLTASTSYYLHFVHRDAAGNDSAVATSAQFTTAAANTSPSFTGPNIDNISGTEGVALTPVDVSAKFFDSESGLTFSTVGSWPAGVTVSSAGVISGTPTTAGTYASLQVRATDAGSLTADSNAFTITVAAPGDAENPTLTGSVTFASITQTSYTANWPAGLDNVAVTGYEYQIGGTGGAWTDVGDNLSAAITGRTAGTTETVYVRAYDAAGNRSTPAISGEVTLLAAVAGITVTEPLKNNTGTVLASQSGVRVAVLQAADLVSVYETSGLTTNASGILATISDATITAGQQYHVAIKLADGGVGITGPITAS